MVQDCTMTSQVQPKTKWDRFAEGILLLAVALILAVYGNLNGFILIMSAVLGLLGVGRLRTVPEIRQLPHVIINWKNRNQRAVVDRSPSGQAYAAGRDITIINPPPQNQPAQDPNSPNIVPGLRVGIISQGTEMSEILVSLEASNRGPVPVFVRSISSLRVLMPDNMAMTPLSDTWASDTDFPFELGPGRAYTIWRDARGFANSMKRNGYNGRVNLVVMLTDEAGREFKSGPILFDIDDYANNA